MDDQVVRRLQIKQWWYSGTLVTRLTIASAIKEPTTCVYMIMPQQVRQRRRSGFTHDFLSAFLVSHDVLNPNSLRPLSPNPLARVPRSERHSRPGFPVRVTRYGPSPMSQTSLRSHWFLISRLKLSVGIGHALLVLRQHHQHLLTRLWFPPRVSVAHPSVKGTSFEGFKLNHLLTKA